METVGRNPVRSIGARDDTASTKAAATSLDKKDGTLTPEPTSAGTDSLLVAVPNAKATSRDSPLTNGQMVRFVGRNRLRNGPMISVITVLIAIFLLPLFLLLLVLMRCKRGRHVWFQHFGWGPGPPLPPALTAAAGRPGAVRFVCISDTHMMHDGIQLPPGDVLVHCGDFTNWGALDEIEAFGRWFNSQPHKHKLIVPGNHDMLLDEPYYADYWADWSKKYEDVAAARAALAPATLLHDTSITINGVVVYGSPYVPRAGLPTRTAFNREPDEMREIWGRMPECDVLLTHSPPLGAGDLTAFGQHDCSCAELRRAILEQSKPPQFHVFGHVHTDWGAHMMAEEGARTIHINAASVSDYYVVRRNAPIVFDVEHQPSK